MGITKDDRPELVNDDVSDRPAGLSRVVWSGWLRSYALHIALGLTGILFGFGRGDGLLILLGCGLLLQPAGAALSLSNVPSWLKSLGRSTIRVGRLAFFLLCLMTLLREFSKVSLRG